MDGMDWKCRYHPDIPYAGICRGCGALLCEACLGRHTPPLCARCVEKKYRGQRNSAILILAILVASFLVGYISQVPSPFSMLFLDLDVQPHPFFRPTGDGASRYAFTPLANGILFALHAFAFIPAITVVLSATGFFGIKLSPFVLSHFNLNVQSRMQAGMILLFFPAMVVAVVGLSFFAGHIVLPVLLLYYGHEIMSSGKWINKVPQWYGDSKRRNFYGGGTRKRFR